MKRGPQSPPLASKSIGFALGMLIAGLSVAGFASAAEEAGVGLRSSFSTWSTFAASASPRPIVVLGAALVAPDGGFNTQNEQTAFADQHFALLVHWPSAPSSWHQYQIEPANRAFSALKPLTTGHHTAPLEISDVLYTSATFATDRGTEMLPVWAFHVDGGNGTAFLLAISSAQVVTRVPRGPSLIDHASGAAHNRELTVAFYGAPASGPCAASYRIQSRESRGAVVLKLSEQAGPSAPGDQGVACAPVATPREMRIRLASVLGFRVVVDAGSDEAVVLRPAS